MIEKHFKPYNEQLDKIRDMNIELLKMKEDYYNLTGSNYDDVKVKGGKPYDMTDQLHYIVEKEKQIKGIVNYKEELRRVHEREINNIKNSMKRSILKLFYLDRCSIKQIAYVLRRSESHTKSLKREAVDEFIKKVIMEG